MKLLFTVLCFSWCISAFSQSYRSVAHPVVCATESASQRASVPAVPSIASSVPAMPGFVGGYLFPWPEEMPTGVSLVADNGQLSCRWENNQLVVSAMDVDMAFEVYSIDGRLYGRGKGRGFVRIPESCRMVIVRVKTPIGRHVFKMMRP